MPRTRWWWWWRVVVGLHFNPATAATDQQEGASFDFFCFYFHHFLPTTFSSKAVQPCSLDEMLEMFTEAERLEGGRVYNCSECNKKQNHEHGMLLLVATHSYNNNGMLLVVVAHTVVCYVQPSVMLT